jgi:hypothetical protein
VHFSEIGTERAGLSEYAVGRIRDTEVNRESIPRGDRANTAAFSHANRATARIAAVIVFVDR